MRILHLDPDDVDNPLSGGGPVRTLEIYKRLARRHEITVLTPTFPGSTAETVRDGIRYLRLGRKIGDHGSSHHLTFLAALPAAVRRYDYELLVEDTMPPASATWTPLFRRSAVPLIASVQWWFAAYYTRRLKLPFHWGEQFGIRLYKHFVVLTEQMRRTIEGRHRGADCRVIPNGVDAGLFTLPLRVGDSILYLGRLEIRAKGLDLLLTSLATLEPPRRPRLIVAGSGDGQAELDHQITQLGLRPWITQVGKVDSVERARLLESCRFTVMPSRDETFGMTIAEANAAGKVALTFDAWPMNEVAAPDSPRATAFDPASYAHEIGRLMDLPDASLLALGDRCRAWARRFDWDVVATAQEQFYEEVHARHRHARGEAQ